MSLPDSTASDARLLREIADGSFEAFGAFYDLYCTALYSIAFHVLKDPCEAEEVLQEVFLTLWQKAHAFDESLGKPVSWIVRITRNEAIDSLRARGRWTRRNGAGFDCSAVIESVAAPQDVETLEAEHISQIRAELRRLPANQRQAIDLAFFGGLTHTQIAHALSVPLGTIKARIRRGMVSLRDVLDLEMEKNTVPQVDEGNPPMGATEEPNNFSSGTDPSFVWTRQALRSVRSESLP